MAKTGLVVATNFATTISALLTESLDYRRLISAAGRTPTMSADANGKAILTDSVTSSVKTVGSGRRCLTLSQRRASLALTIQEPSDEGPEDIRTASTSIPRICPYPALVRRPGREQFLTHQSDADKKVHDSFTCSLDFIGAFIFLNSVVRTMAYSQIGREG